MSWWILVGVVLAGFCANVLGAGSAAACSLMKVYSRERENRIGSGIRRECLG